MGKSVQVADDLKKLSGKVVLAFYTLQGRHFKATMDNFRDISLLPTLGDINRKDFNPISRVLVKGPYDDVDHYVGLQFRLLREDFVAAIRAGIKAYRDASADIRSIQRRFDNIRVYSGVQFEKCKLSEIGSIAYVVNFKPKRNITADYETSKYFMHGSLLLFSQDDFRTFFCARVQRHDVELLNSGRLYVTMECTDDFMENVILDTDATFTMIEPNVFWEPYSLVLKILRETFSEFNFPMREFIIEASSKVDSPRYLSQFNEWMVLGKRTKPLNFDTWPTCENLRDLDASQYEALRTALTKKFCVIQGPPGTGKTRLGLKIVEILLYNMVRSYYIRSPILIICYTNHALDQFLEGILENELTSKIIRVGSQSSSERLINYSLKEKRAARKAQWLQEDEEDRGRKKKKNWTRRIEKGRLLNHEIGKGHSECKSMLLNIDQLNENLEMLNKPEGIFSFECLEDVMKANEKTVLSSDFALVTWLLDEKEAVFPDFCEDDVKFLDEFNYDETAVREIFGELFKIEEESVQERFVENTKKNLSYSISVHGLGAVVKHYSTKLNSITNQHNMEFTWARAHLTNLVHRYFILREHLEETCAMKGARRLRRKDDLLTLPLEDRWSIYFHWINAKKISVVEKIKWLKLEYSSTAFRIEQCQNEDTADLLRSAHVVGMTTTCAARCNSVLQHHVKPSIGKF